MLQCAAIIARAQICLRMPLFITAASPRWAYCRFSVCYTYGAARFAMPVSLHDLNFWAGCRSGCCSSFFLHFDLFSFLRSFAFFFFVFSLLADLQYAWVRFLLCVFLIARRADGMADARATCSSLKLTLQQRNRRDGRSSAGGNDAPACGCRRNVQKTAAALVAAPTRCWVCRS